MRTFTMFLIDVAAMFGLRVGPARIVIPRGRPGVLRF